MIAIDFVAGSHGHYMEYVANRFVAKIPADFDPFNVNNASHTRPKDYYDSAKFVAEHYFEKGVPATQRILRITFTKNDLLPLTSVSLRRAGDYNIDNNLLEIDTYNKLKNQHYSYLIDIINQSYPEAGISAQSPNCARHILREYFKFGFRDPEQHGFMIELNRLMYHADRDIFDFPLSDLYDLDRFVSRCQTLSTWYDSGTLDLGNLKNLHVRFLEKQIYKDHSVICNKIIDAVQKQQSMAIPELTLFQESYINGVIEKLYQVEMPFLQTKYFTDTQQILDHILGYCKDRQ
jgi:hypothetical protein